jgi:hypothetical protein
MGLNGQPFIALPNRQIDLGQAEAGDRQIEIEVEFFQLQQILAEQTLVPVRVLRQPVVGDACFSLLFAGSMSAFPARAARPADCPFGGRSV